MVGLVVLGIPQGPSLSPRFPCLKPAPVYMFTSGSVIVSKVSLPRTCSSLISTRCLCNNSTLREKKSQYLSKKGISDNSGVSLGLRASSCVNQIVISNKNRIELYSENALARVFSHLVNLTKILYKNDFKI